jgi:hypothetical protein
VAAGTDVISKEKASHVFPELSRFRSKRYDLRKNGFAQARGRSCRAARLRYLSQSYETLPLGPLGHHLRFSQRQPDPVS